VVGLAVSLPHIPSPKSLPIGFGGAFFSAYHNTNGSEWDQKAGEPTSDVENTFDRFVHLLERLLHLLIVRLHTQT
jgi:hypothetical protein